MLSSVPTLKKNLPSNFRQMIESYRDQYTDKSMFIAEALNMHNKINFFESSLPIGKSLNLSMFHHFLTKSIDGVATAPLFKDLEISKHQEVMRQQGKFNVVYLDFNNLIVLNHDELRAVLLASLHKLIREFDLQNSNQLNEYDKQDIEALLHYDLESKKDELVLKRGLSLLLKLIRKSLNDEAPFLLIDGCDNLTPKDAVITDIYDKSKSLLESFFLTLKDNTDYDTAFIVAHKKENLRFLPQFCPHTNLEKDNRPSSKYFGFTADEVENLINRYKIGTAMLDVAFFRDAKEQTPIFTPTSAFDLILSELNVQLGNASYLGELEKVKELLNLGADVNTKKAGRHNQTGPQVPIIAAANYGRTDVVKYLLEQGADINTKSEYERSALLFAVSDCTGRRKEDYLDTVKLLIQSGADINAIDDEGVTVLMHAIHNNNLPAVAELIKAGANLNLVDKEGKSVLHHMSYSPNKNTHEIFKLLINAGVNVNATDRSGESVISFVAKYCKNSQIVDLLINAGANQQDLYKTGKTELMYAISWNDEEKARRLIQDNDLDYLAKQDNGGRTALMYAVQEKLLDLVKLMVEKNKKSATDHWSNFLLEQQDKSGDTPVFYALHEPILNYLIQTGADIEHINNGKTTVLLHALDFQLFKTVELLLNKKLSLENINTKCHGSGFHDGETALHMAVRRAKGEPGTYKDEEANKKIALLLLKAGADPKIPCGGLTVAEIASDKDIKDLLLLKTLPTLSKFSFLNKMPADVSDKEMAQSCFAKRHRM